VVDNFASGTQTPPIVTPPIVQPIPTVKQPVAQSIPTVTQQNNQNNNTNSVPPWMQILLNFAAPAAGSLLNQALQNGSNNISPTQQKIVDNLKDIRGKTQTIVEQGSIHLANGGGKDPINNNLRFTGDKLDSFKKINSELSKSPAYKNMPYYLQQEISNNMSNYVVRLMATAEGSKELKEWMKANGKTASSYSEYNKLAIDYALEQMKPLADDVTKKYADLKAQGKTDKEILDTLIKDKAGKGLIDLGSYRDEIEKNGIFNPYTISSKFEYRDYRGGEVHYGIDTTDGGYATGRMIQTPLGGKIEFIGEKIGYGKMVIIEHHSNLRSNLGHLAGIDENLKKDQQVSKGLTTIGEMGNTDRVDGTASGKVRIHLHHDMDYSLDGKTWDLGKTIKLNPTEFSADLQSYLKAGTGRSLETFMKSQEFKTHLTNLQTFLDTTASNHPDVKDYCDKQVKLIKQALAKFK
jgi:murein DD-endopeptidase MepM/ murein hydrolase activator NlpD